MEAAYEADLALRFLEAGLYRNAAGKAFQAFKALLAALATKYRDALAQGSSATTLLGARKMAVTGVYSGVHHELCPPEVLCISAKRHAEV